MSIVKSSARTMRSPGQSFSLLALLVLTASAAFSAVSASPILIYPDNVANPRVPCVRPIIDNVARAYMPVKTQFEYPLSSIFSGSANGSLTMFLRDDPARETKDLVTLTDGPQSLTIHVTAASDGRKATLVANGIGTPVPATANAVTLNGDWTKAEITWDNSHAALAIAGKPLASVALARAFVPAAMTVSTYYVTDLDVRQGNSHVSLNWQNGYAAAATFSKMLEVRSLNVMGFDSYYVSRNPAHRDCPVVLFSNCTDSTAKAILKFALRGEVTASTYNWTQSVTIPPDSQTVLPIAWPKTVNDDIWHLGIASDSATTPLREEKHFVIIDRRDEAAGPSKFGLHDSDRQLYGFWPDALPIDLAHLYARWGYIVGPAWANDYNGMPGIDPDTPPAEWNWDPRLDAAIDQGLTPYVCIGGDPMLDWMRQPGFDASKAAIKYAWGPLGGRPDDKRYRQFVHALAEHYRGQVRMYEIQNEPNAFPPGGIDPDDYVARLKAAYEEIHAVDPSAKVYGICGTGDFVPWMKRVIALGGGKYMDAISFHTYTTPRSPDDAGLADKLAQVRQVAMQYGKPVEFINSETGTYVALRETVDHPISNSRLADLIKAGTPTLSLAHGWPNYALDETTGASSVVQNCVYNFLAGARRFVFFGWNPDWPSKDWWTNSHDDGFAIISMTKDGIRTPSRYTLSIGVLTAQLEPATLSDSSPIRDGSLRGGIFRTAGGGSVAVVWSTAGTRTATFRVDGGGVDAVSLFGQPFPASIHDGMLQVSASEQPIYLHLRRGQLTPMPSPISEPEVTAEPSGEFLVRYAVKNATSKPWIAHASYDTPAGWTVLSADLPIRVPANGQTLVSANFKPEAGGRGRVVIGSTVTIDGGAKWQNSFAVTVKPITEVLRATTGPATFDAIPGSPLSVRTPDQVAIGRPPALVSLQDPTYWEGPAELSGQVKLGWTQKALTVAVKVHDANYAPPASWPGVGGSCVELFFDFRQPGHGLGSAQSGPGVYQVILKPQGDSPPSIWNAHGPLSDSSGQAATGNRDPNGDYTVCYTIPWAAVGLNASNGTQFGFDIAIDGPPASTPGRKSQMVLFGNAGDFDDASGYGTAILK